MVSLAEATRKALIKFPFIEDYLKSGAINYRGLARAIEEDVARELCTKKVNLETISTVVRRYANSFKGKETKVAPRFKVLSKSSVGLQRDIAVLTIKMSWELPKQLEKLREAVSKRGGELFYTIQNPSAVTIVVNQRYLNEILKFLKKESILQLRKNLAAILIDSPEEIAETPGVISEMAIVLARYNISVVELVSSFTHTTFIVEGKKAIEAYEVISKLVDISKKID
ncbi:MAG: ACT domain-containing protein [Euryarchaeota archaeon]|nr:ACT domain-containing protein [Euryarchaeota archaeon]